MRMLLRREFFATQVFLQVDFGGARWRIGARFHAPSPPTSLGPASIVLVRMPKKDAGPKKAKAGAKGDKAEKKGAKEPKAGKKEKAPKDEAAPAAAPAAPVGAAAPPPGSYGAMLFPRVGPFAPPSGSSFFSGGGYGAGGSIYGGAGGHPYLRHTALASHSPMMGPRMPGSPPRGAYGLPVTAAGSLGGGPAGADALAGMGSNAIALAQAYQTRMSALSSVAASLLSKRETMVHQLARVQSRMGEVAAAREAIEAETLADMEAVLHRLRSAEAGKFAVLQRDADVLMGDISATDAFYSALTSFHAPGGGGGAGALPPPGLYDPATALAFMRAYPELCAEADRLAVKPVRQDVDVAADDFEREVASRNELAQRYAALVDLVAAKDRIILQLLKVRAYPPFPPPPFSFYYPPSPPPPPTHTPHTPNAHVRSPFAGEGGWRGRARGRAGGLRARSRGSCCFRGAAKSGGG
jgi:hypothetical protein